MADILPYFATDVTPCGGGRSNPITRVDMRILSLTAGILVFSCSTAAASVTLTGKAAELYDQAIREGAFASAFLAVSTEVKATSDNRAFYVRWQNTERPKTWMVTLHGAGNPAKGFATDDFSTWFPYVKDRDIGVISLQWWLGTGSTTADFYTPDEIHREVTRLLEALRVEPGTAMLVGFSRGSANSYAVKAIDSGMGKSYFALTVASSGGVGLDYAPTQAILNGDYGVRPLNGTKWVTSAGARDPEPDRDGITGMRATAEWLASQGASVVQMIEDPSYGHGALVLNETNARMVLDLFFDLVTTAGQ